MVRETKTPGNSIAVADLPFVVGFGQDRASAQPSGAVVGLRSHKDPPIAAVFPQVVDLICPACRAPVGEQAPYRPCADSFRLEVGPPGGQPLLLEHGHRRPAHRRANRPEPPGRWPSKAARHTRSGRRQPRYASAAGLSSSPPSALAVRRVRTPGAGTPRHRDMRTRPGSACSRPQESRSLPFPRDCRHQGRQAAAVPTPNPAAKSASVSPAQVNQPAGPDCTCPSMSRPSRGDGG